ncbi:MAG: tetratricopeptide repeat protein [Ignavibacterium sp.]|nr:tetratricopeptide repeat protein [Ignavibacterium sp.]MDW8374470.1 tetratricopeptide repeat protein [Ignavibacteriales bacterium]
MKKKFNLFSLAITLTLFTTGCSVWENFTTYFNRWYNIKQIYNEIEADIQSQKKNIFSTEPIVLSSNSRNNLPKLIDKCSDLLQFNKNSAFVDDALLILGKAFYYQANYQKSKRKFEELLLTNPSEEERLEAELWIAKCEMQMKNFNVGLNAIRSVGAKAIEKDYEKLIEESFVEEIKYFKSIEEYKTAIELLERFTKYISDDELLALTYYELGNLYFKEGNYIKSAENYQLAIENTSDFDIEINATLNYASSLRMADKVEESLEFLEGIRTKDKFSESLPKIELEIGKAYVLLNRFEEALDKFTIVDTTFKNSPYSALALYEIGKIYENNLLNFDSAAHYFNRSQLSNPPREFQKEIFDKNTLFSTYSRLRKTIDNYDRQLFYANNPEIFKQDSIAYVEDSLRILQEYLEKKELYDIWNSISEASQNKPSINYLSLRDSAFVRDSIKLADSLSKFFVRLEPDSIIKILLVKAFYRDSIKFTDSLKLEGISFEDDELKIALEERRRNLVSYKQNKTTYTDISGSIPVDSLNFKKNPPTKPTIPLDKLKNDLAKNRLQLGNLFFTELEIPDSAYKLYYEIVRNFDSTDYYPDALYALGTFYLTVNDKPKADSLFRKIYDEYKHLSIVNSAADKLGLPLIDLTFDPGKEIYLKAESYIKSKNYKDGINNFLEIYKKFPESKFADKGLYAAGFILENDLRLLDSAVVVYDTLLTKYPNSEFIKLIAMKVTIYKQEKARLQRELEESKNKQVTKIDENVGQVFEGNTNEEELTEKEKENKIEEKLTTKKTDINITSNKKKLERLWNPRKHKR